MLRLKPSRPLVYPFLFMLALSMALPTLAFAQTPSVVSALSAEEVLERYITALGGRDAWKRLTSEERIVESDDGSVTISASDAANGRFYNRTEGSDGVTERGFDGKNVWEKSPSFRGILDDADPFVTAVRKRAPTLLQYRESGEKFSRAADEQLDGRTYVVLEVTRQGFARPFTQKYYFDAETFLLRRQAMKGLGTIIDFDDYRKISGVMEPLARTEIQPNGTVHHRVKYLKKGAAVPDSLFAWRDGPPSSYRPKAQNREPIATPPQMVAPKRDSAVAEMTGRTVADSVRVKTLNLVWRTIRDTQWDTTFGGANWQAVRDKYAVLTRNVADENEFHRLLNQMVNELHLTHFRVSPPVRDRASVGTTGLSLIWLDNEYVIEDVTAGSASATAGLVPGMVITAINGHTPAEMLAAYDANGQPARREVHRRVRAANRELGGKPGEAVQLTVADGGSVRDIDVTRAERRALTSFSDLVHFESRRLTPDIGYIAFSIFQGDVIPRMKAALDSMKDVKGLVLDLRGNPGGEMSILTAVAGLLSERDGSLGTMKFRYETRPMNFRGSTSAYTGPVVVLVDARSASCSEVLAGGLQSSGRVRVVGDTTAGAVLPSEETPLPTGGVLQFAVSDYFTPTGVRLEGRGVLPDVAAMPTRAALRAGRDVVIEKAVALITR